MWDLKHAATYRATFYQELYKFQFHVTIQDIDNRNFYVLYLELGYNIDLSKVSYSHLRKNMTCFIEVISQGMARFHLFHTTSHYQLIGPNEIWQ